MKPTLVTGASGFIGGHVLRVLLERGDTVRAMVRGENRLTCRGVDLVEGDLRDAASLARAVAGCAVVFHVAADYRLWVKNPRDMFESNVQGTSNLIRAARSAGVERFIYTSTVGCVNVPKNGVGDETMLVSREEMSEAVLGRKFHPFDRALDMHVSRLRRKLADSGGSEEQVKTIRGSGYQLAVNLDTAVAGD